MTTALATPENTALIERPSGMPLPTASMTARSGVPSSTSPTSGATTSPTTVATVLPGDAAVLMVRNHSAPRTSRWATVTRVSTLFTSVGLGPLRPASPWAAVASHPSWGATAKRPCSWGANHRGRGGLPSMTSSIAFSSPKRYSSGPATTVTVQCSQMPAAWVSCTARVTAAISSAKEDFRQMNASSAATAKAAMTTPSTSW